MNVKNLFLGLLICTICVQIEFMVVNADEPMTVNIMSPKNNEHVNADLVILKVNVTTATGPLPWVRVDYYVDGKFLKTDFTGYQSIDLGQSAVWYKNATLGAHSWYVKVSKQGYIDKTSTTMHLYADFFPKLKLTTQYSTKYGDGTYPKNQKVTFGVNQTTVYINNYTRSVFTGWISQSSGGYNGPDAQHLITMSDNIEEQAIWKTQYYLNITSDYGMALESGWYDAGAIITLGVQPDEGYKFITWRGIGVGSYTGSTVNGTITMNGPISQEAVYDQLPVYQLLVLSDYGNVTGSGPKYEGLLTNFSVIPNVVQISDGVRVVFDGWTSGYPNGYNGTDNPAQLVVKNYVIEEAHWKKQYYVSVNDPKYIDLEKWYTENKAINLEQKTDGFLIKRTLNYKVNGVEITSPNIVVTEPLNIEVYWVSDYLYAIILVVGIAAVFVFIIYRIMKM